MMGIGHVEKWASGVLSVVSLVLVIRLAWHPASSRAGAAHSRQQASYTRAPREPRQQTTSRRSSEDLARYDPVVRLDLLKTLQARPIPRFERNPFEFEAPPKVAPAAVPGGSPSGSAAAPPAQPPPPSVPLKPLGYTEKPGGVREGLVSDEEQIYVVHEGDVFAKRFRVLKITPTAIEIEDESFHQTVQLPFNK